MTPESFNAALAQRKLEAADILLHQAKRGSDADRIRAASAILRIAFFPIANSPSLMGARAGGRVQGSTENPAAAEQPAPAPHSAPATPPLPLPAGEGRGEGVQTLDSQAPEALGHTPVSTSDSPYHRGGLTGSPSHPPALSSA